MSGMVNNRNKNKNRVAKENWSAQKTIWRKVISINEFSRAKLSKI